MAIETNDTILKFGTQDEVTVASPAAVDGDDGISLTSDINTWTNDDDAPMVSVVLNVTFAAVPDTGTIDIFVTMDDIQSTNDEPDADSAFAGHYLGSITPDQVTASHYLAGGPWALPVTASSQVYQFYIKNSQGDAAHDISSGWSMWVTPVSYGPHA